MLKIFQLESAAPGVLRAAEVREGEVPRGARADRELHHRQGDSGTAGGSQGETTRIIHILDEKYFAERGVEMLTRICMVWFQGGLTKSTGGGIEGCGITKYSGSHSFNPLLLSKSSNNLSVKKVFSD